MKSFISPNDSQMDVVAPHISLPRILMKLASTCGRYDNSSPNIDSIYQMWEEKILSVLLYSLFKYIPVNQNNK